MLKASCQSKSMPQIPWKSLEQMNKQYKVCTIEDMIFKFKKKKYVPQTKQ